METPVLHFSNPDTEKKIKIIKLFALLYLNDKSALVVAFPNSGHVVILSESWNIVVLVENKDGEFRIPVKRNSIIVCLGNDDQV